MDWRKEVATAKQRRLIYDLQRRAKLSIMKHRQKLTKGGASKLIDLLVEFVQEREKIDHGIPDNERLERLSRQAYNLARKEEKRL